MSNERRKLDTMQEPEEKRKWKRIMDKNSYQTKV